MATTFSDRMEAKTLERIEAFKRLGITVERGGCLGWLRFSAGEADKVLRILKREATAANPSN